MSSQAPLRRGSGRWHLTGGGMYNPRVLVFNIPMLGERMSWSCGPRGGGLQPRGWASNRRERAVSPGAPWSSRSEGVTVQSLGCKPVEEGQNPEPAPRPTPLPGGVLKGPNPATRTEGGLPSPGGRAASRQHKQLAAIPKLNNV